MAVFPGTRGSPALLDRLAEDEEVGVLRITAT